MRGEGGWWCADRRSAAAAVADVLASCRFALVIGNGTEVDALALFAEVFHGDLSSSQDQLGCHGREEFVEPCRDRVEVSDGDA